MSLTWIQTLLLALLQGVTELFPISSLGHTVIIPGLLGWTALVQSPQFLPIVVAFHLGTSIALVLFFWRDWWRVIYTLGQSIQRGEVKQGDASWVSWLVIIGSVPGGLLGVLLKKQIEHLFASPLIAATFLILNGSLLLLGEALRRRLSSMLPRKEVAVTPDHPFPQLGLPPEKRAALGLPPEKRAALGLPPRPETRTAIASAIEAPGTMGLTPRKSTFRPLVDLSWKEAIIIGLAQAFALLPGISRSGASIVAGLGVGLSHEDAARYSFLLGTPLIAGAALLEMPELANASGITIVLVLVGMALSGLAAYLSTKFLMKYFETGHLHPFAYYCWGVGGISLVLFLLGVGAH